MHRRNYEFDKPPWHNGYKWDGIDMWGWFQTIVFDTLQ
jgi:hypothetical protein